MTDVTLLRADARHLPLEDASVDAIVCDPPYELGFMGKTWDNSGVAYQVETWGEALRVLKPGGHLLAFGGTRTHHRLMVAIEDSGFEIRDVLMWLYGSGFPKSLDVSKAIDRQRDDREQVRTVCRWLRATMEATGTTSRTIAEAFGFDPRMADHWAARDTDSQPTTPTLDQIPTLLDVLGNPDVPSEIERLILDLNGRKGQPGDDWFRREKVGERTHIQGGGAALELRRGERREVVQDVSLSATDEARRWEGWGTALKPAYEPIVLARKPLSGTVAANVLAHGTGGLNINGTRIGTSKDVPASPRRGANGGMAGGVYGEYQSPPTNTQGWNPNVGRWPANLLLDEGAAALLDASTGDKGAGGRASGPTLTGPSERHAMAGGFGGTDREAPFYGDSGGPSRFFYTSKASRTEREEGLIGFLPCSTCGGVDTTEHETAGGGTARCRRNNHPTVKPVDLMRWLVTLVTPPGGKALDPFMGSGGTGVAALGLGFNFIGSDLDEHYIDIARWRIAHAASIPTQTLMEF